ncbi:MAG: mevalonate kinase [Thaumarchaeota archaeon]|nr:mevalonate kinase [Nitrososphaerota archaeon]MCL5318442.1 mevalonate kinase [Nitrososphaerota archaeon]
MTTFTATAPGKIIIAGEHFVVHGSYALAAAIDRGSTVQASPSNHPVIVSKSLGLVADLEGKVPDRLRPLAKTLGVTLKWLNESRGVKCELESNIPISAGLGSSAAGSVALVAAASAALGHQLKLNEIFDLAMVSERIIHGNPSGIDPAVATYGGVMLFSKGAPHKPVQLKTPADFIIGFSGVDRSTSKMIHRFSESQASHPSTFRALVRSTSVFAENAAKALSEGDLNSLAAILNFNHMILSSLGVSSPTLDNLVEAALDAGCLGAKLTGGGGGGCIIALPTSDNLDAALTQLRRSAADAWISRIPQSGVKVWKSGD